MKTIEERAIEYEKKHRREIYSWDDLCKYRATQQAQLAAYTKGAEDQKTIDINKACKWFADYLMEIGYPDDWMRNSSNMLSGEERFRKAMEG